MLAEWTARIGQDLFYPPNVGGWPGGRGWIHTRSMIARANYAAALVAGTRVGRTAPYDHHALPKKYGFGAGPAAVLTFHHRLLYGVNPGDELRQRLGTTDGRQTVTALLAAPEAQLG